MERFGLVVHSVTTGQPQTAEQDDRVTSDPFLHSQLQRRRHVAEQNHSNENQMYKILVFYNATIITRVLFLHLMHPLFNASSTVSK